ncbi:MAG: Glycosyl transferase family 2 [Microgenomates group bacterium GW2011_GWC1_39_12]|nr:MAG: Glycosyl transferase family 2 [Microgenomates group bacterium GW2011_GWC1_39_12]
MISAVVLTHNNEDVICKTLESVSWCDERIIVDDNSTDRTLEVVKPYDVIIIQHALNDDFSTQRNIGLAKAKGEWVLFVDSDEIVPIALQKEILSLPKDDKYIGYYVNRKDILFGRELRYGETANVKLLRLAKKGTGVWVRPVHETWNVRGPVASFTTPLLHYPHKSVSAFLSQINRYTTINAKVFFDQGIRTSALQIIMYPIAKFIQNYIFRLGFLDGVAGLVIAIMMSFHSFLTRGKIWELQQKNI